MATLADFSNFALRSKSEKCLLGSLPKPGNFGPRQRKYRFATSGQLGPKYAPLYCASFPHKARLCGDPFCPKSSRPVGLVCVISFLLGCLGFPDIRQAEQPVYVRLYRRQLPHFLADRSVLGIGFLFCL